ncbi:MAG TPA: response regulator [Burkholderiales bacterium]|nr:response regulator [Burkholderiales bacterium]
MPAEAVRPRALAIYIVDTDCSVREGLSRLAESAGFEPRPCKSAEDLLCKEPVGKGACVVLDLSDASLRKPEIRARLMVVATMLPVIALSAADDPQTQRKARELGAKALFRKPVDAAALVDSIAWHTRETPSR